MNEVARLRMIYESKKVTADAILAWAMWRLKIIRRRQKKLANAKMKD